MMINSNVVGIIADDLTGANDCALQFHLKGANTQILLNDEFTPLNIDKSQIWAISTESRNVTPHEAYEKVKHAVKMLVDTINPDYFFKKIDSTVRGNIAVEVLGFLEVLNWDAAIIVPAFPQQGRITIGGYHLLNGVPIERTEMARDPHSPIFESHLPTLLKSQLPDEFTELVGSIELSTVMKGAGPILKKINELIESGKKIIVADAVSITDINQLVLAITKNEYKILPTGTAALSNALSDVWVSDAEKNTVDDVNSDSNLPDLPKFIVSGSATQINANQIEKLAEQQNPNCYMIALEILQVLSGVKEELVNDIVSHLTQNKSVVVYTSDLFKNFGCTPVNSLRAELTKTELANIITDFLSELVKKVLEKTQLILITLGGETSYKCCAEIGSHQLELLDEVAPAIALSKDQNEQLIVTKSGNLGDSNTLIDILNYFQE